MWGICNIRDHYFANKIFSTLIDPTVSKAFNPPNKKNRRGSDQPFLRKYVYPFIKENSITHDSYLCKLYGGKAFPSQRQGNCFVGMLKFNF
jgi:hypothetical protein